MIDNHSDGPHGVGAESGKGEEVSGNLAESVGVLPAPSGTRGVAPIVHERGGGSLDPLALKQRLMCADAAAICVGVIVAFVLQEILRPVPQHIWSTHGRLLAVSAPVWVIAMGMSKLYASRANERRIEEFRRIFAATGAGVGSVIVLAFATQYKELSPPVGRGVVPQHQRSTHHRTLHCPAGVRQAP